MKIKTYQLLLIPLLASLAFTATYIRIPLPSGGMIHLGNFVVMIGALIIGGPLGGLAGGIGCGLFDLLIYNDPIGMVAYFILKFLMGLIVGLIFKFSKKKVNFQYTLFYIIISSIILLLTTFVIVGYENQWFKLSSTIDNPSLYVWLVCILGYIFSIMLISASIFSKKLKPIQKGVLLASSIAVITNIIFEMIYKVLKYVLIEDLPFAGATIKSISVIPSCLLTGALTVVIVTIIFPLVYNGVKSVTDKECDIYE